MSAMRKSYPPEFFPSPPTPPAPRLPLSLSFRVLFSNATWQTSLPSNLIDPRIRERFAMTHRLFLLICAISLFCLGLASGTLADNSHAPIVRLSLVPVDVQLAPTLRTHPPSDTTTS